MSWRVTSKVFKQFSKAFKTTLKSARLKSRRFRGRRRVFSILFSRYRRYYKRIRKPRIFIPTTGLLAAAPLLTNSSQSISREEQQRLDSQFKEVTRNMRF